MIEPFAEENVPPTNNSEDKENRSSNFQAKCFQKVHIPPLPKDHQLFNSNNFANSRNIGIARDLSDKTESTPSHIRSLDLFRNFKEQRISSGTVNGMLTSSRGKTEGTNGAPIQSQRNHQINTQRTNTTIKNVDEIYNEYYWQTKVDNLIREKKQILESTKLTHNEMRKINEEN